MPELWPLLSVFNILFRQWLAPVRPNKEMDPWNHFSTYISFNRTIFRINDNSIELETKSETPDYVQDIDHRETYTFNTFICVGRVFMIYIIDLEDS